MLSPNFIDLDGCGLSQWLWGRAWFEGPQGREQPKDGSDKV